MSDLRWPGAMEEVPVAHYWAAGTKTRLKARPKDGLVADAEIHWKAWTHAWQVRHHVVETCTALWDVESKHGRRFQPGAHWP